jgi:hypothetical protein
MPTPRPASSRPLRLGASALAALLLCLSSVAVVACGSTIEEEPVAPSTLEQLIALHEYPVYWLGNTFAHLSVSEISRDNGGAYIVQYGTCLSGGQFTCAAPLTIVTSPENSFVAHGPAGLRTLPMRGVSAFIAPDGHTIEIATGAVVVSVRADSTSLARDAARWLVPINMVGVPDAPLPKALPTSRFATQPLPGQLKTSQSKSH